ncbi:MAG TPA: hypothetical protein GXX75_04765 [Clostridiales bacterium]|nr:hypothetical protein [Clostridiales bacterium]
MKRYSIAVLISVVFTVSFITSPSVTGLNEHRVSYTASPKSLVHAQKPLSRTGRSHFISEFSGNEMLKSVETHLIINRNIQNLPNMIYKVNPFLLLLIGLGVFTYRFGYVIRKKQQDRSILSSFLGGHAPPGYFITA